MLPILVLLSLPLFAKEGLSSSLQPECVNRQILNLRALPSDVRPDPLVLVFANVLMVVTSVAAQGLVFWRLTKLEGPLLSVDSGSRSPDGTGNI